MKSEKEIEDYLFGLEETTNKFPGMTYEQGVYYALLWVLGDEDIEDPMAE